jgi:methylmalonyl-CoA mutase
VIRATPEEKEQQITNLVQMQKGNASKSAELLEKLQESALHNENTFEALMESAKYCSLGQITHAMFEVGGQYRRNM